MYRKSCLVPCALWVITLYPLAFGPLLWVLGLLYSVSQGKTRASHPARSQDCLAFFLLLEGESWNSA